MPLIRYRIGDLAVLDTKECDCGLNTPILKEILGRIDHFIITPDGRKIGRLSPVLKGFPIREAQYIQRRVDQLIVRVVTAEGFDKKTEKDIKIELRKRIGSEMAIKVETVNSIERGPGGKLRTVISEIS
jgi:phenylacetate-CoA ligase